MSTSNGMVDEYRVHLENLSFSNFSRMMEAARGTNELVRRISRIGLTSRSNLSSSGIKPLPLPRKRPIIEAVERSQGPRLSTSKKSFYRQEYK